MQLKIEEILEKGFAKQNAILQAIAGERLDPANMSYLEIQKIVQSGLAHYVFKIGDQINANWTDASGTKYVIPFDVVDFRDVTKKSGDVVPGMILQMHYCTPFGIQFSAQQAFYYCEEELPAGTYNIYLDYTWGSNCVAGKTYKFTLTQSVPAGGHLTGFYGAPDVAPTNWKVESWESSTVTSPIEKVSVVEGSEGTNLGTFTAYGSGNINSLQRVAYGNNRWLYSAFMQWANSKEEKMKWWKSTNKFDHFPAELLTQDGFMRGFEQEFLDILSPIKVETKANTVTDEGVVDVTYNTFFLPSLEEMYCVPQWPGVEGSYFDYWKQASGLSSPNAQYSTNPNMRIYALNAKTSPQTCRLRSAHTGNASSTWNISTSGHIYYGHHASSSYRGALDCT